MKQRVIPAGGSHPGYHTIEFTVSNREVRSYGESTEQALAVLWRHKVRRVVTPHIP